MNEFRTIYTAAYPEEDTYIYNLAFEDNLLVSSGSDGALRLWDSETLKMSSTALQAHKEISDVKISEKHIIMSCGNDGVVKLWDSRTLGACGEFKTGFQDPSMYINIKNAREENSSSFGL